MSLIQAALNKTQKAAQPSEPQPAQPVQKLQAFEAHVEEDILKAAPAPQLPKKEYKNAGISGRTASLLSLLLITAAVYWFQPQPGNWTPASSEKGDHSIKSLEQSFAEGNIPAVVSIPSRNSKKDLELSGIIWDGNDPFAVLNNQIVRAGDRVGKKGRVVEIGRDFAIIEQDGKPLILKLPS